MVRTRRILFEAGDIVAFKLRCATCQGVAEGTLEQLQNIRVCPFCQTLWADASYPTAVTDTLRALRRLSQDQQVAADLCFEISDESDHDGPST